MLTPRKALKASFKAILPQLVFSSFGQSKPRPAKKTIAIPFFVISEQNERYLTSNFGYGISQLKSQSEILNEVPLENYLKKVQINVETINCLCKKRQVEIDVPIRVFRTHYTVTFMPSEQFLAKRYSDPKSNLVYEK